MADKPDRRRPSWWFAVTGWLKESAALVGSVVTLVAAGAALLAFLGGDETSAEVPVVARLTGPGGVSERAFFTHSGETLVSTQYANQEGLSAVWRGADGEHRATVRIDPRSKRSTGFTLLHLDGETGPQRHFAVANGSSLKPGAPVKAYISDTATTDGEVLAVGTRSDVLGVGEIDNLLVVGEVGRATEGGTPLLDERNRVVGMLFAEEAGGVGRTMVIPIEDIRAAFPEAFD
ncbi:MAG: hypothetical protein ACRDK0_01560 [Solirubrobacteraceae bacterium]